MECNGFCFRSVATGIQKLWTIFYCHANEAKSLLLPRLHFATCDFLVGCKHFFAFVVRECHLEEAKDARA